MQPANTSEYYQRQIILSEFGSEKQKLLSKATVVVVGAGGLGCPALLYLVGAGVGKILIVDGDMVQINNLHRQILYTIDDLGKSKAETACLRLRKQNPFIQIEFLNEFLSAQNVEVVIHQADVVIDATDNFETRFLLGDETTRLKIPLVYSAIYGFEGQLSLFNYQDGPQLRDLFPKKPTENATPNCATNGVIGFVPGVMGVLQACEAIKAIANLGDCLSGKLMQINLLTLEKHVFTIAKRESQKSELEPVTHRIKKEEKAMPIKDISSRELFELRATQPESIFLLDVRELYEWKSFNIGGTHIPMNEIDARINEIPKDKNIVVMCKAGVRSYTVAQHLVNRYKFATISNLEGGLMAWKAEIGE